MDVTYKSEHKIIIRSTKKVMGRHMEVKQMNTLFNIYTNLLRKYARCDMISEKKEKDILHIYPSRSTHFQLTRSASF